MADILQKGITIKPNFPLIISSPSSLLCVIAGILIHLQLTVARQLEFEFASNECHRRMEIRMISIIL